MPQPKRLLIIGGVAGGASAAARARRLSEDATIILFERGPNISFANCGLPYHIGGVIADRERLLVQTAAAMRKRFNIDVRTGTEIVGIDLQQRHVIALDLGSGKEIVEPYDDLILSPGAEPIRPPVEGAGGKRVFTLRSLGDMDAIKQAVDLRESCRAIIVGGGYIGLEMAEALRGRKASVTLVELANQVFAPIDPEMASPVHHQLRLHGVDLRLGTSVSSMREEGDALLVRLSTGESIACDLAVLAVGVKPDVKLAREAGLAIGPTGGIAVDEHMRTSDAHVYAVGDAVEATDLVSGGRVLIPLAGPANRQGRIAADNVFGRSSAYKKTQGTSICKVFDLAVAMTGMSEKSLKRAGKAYEKVYVHPANHASYYPGAHPISLKLLFDPSDGRILGAQAVGAQGVDKRIDVLSVAIRAGMTVYDLQDLELSYAPPYGSAKDAVNYAGFVASNALNGDVKVCHVEHVIEPADNQVLVDVRTHPEVEAGTIGAAINIPVDELRSRLDDLPRAKELLVFCQVGLRGYLACRILSQHGFACRNLSGGYKTYQAVRDAMPKPGAHSGGSSDKARADAGVAPPAVESSNDKNGGKMAPPFDSSCSNVMPAARHVDAIGLQCPGPILRLKSELDHLAPGESLTIAASDPAFPGDVRSWCHSTGNELLDVGPKNGHYLATIRRRLKPSGTVLSEPAADAMARKKSIVVFSGDFDKVMAAFIIANGAASMGSDVTMFFTFWGLNALRRAESVKVRKNFVERMFGWMMPRGAGRLGLSRMHMGGMGLAMIKGIMKKKNVSSLEELIQSARSSGVRLVACTMSMDLMGIKREELIDGIEEGGVAMYLDHAESGNVNLFI